MLLQQKTALVFAATGAIGSAVARQFATQGARVYISGRNEETLKRLGKEINAPWQVVDATDEGQVSEYIDRVVGATGEVDIVFNAIGLRAGAAHYATPSTSIEFAKFLLPLQVIVGSQFLTARAAARHMIPKRRGVIITLSASLQQF